MLVFASAIWPQTAPAPAAAAKTAGLETEWDIAVVLREIGAHAGRLIPALDKLDLKSWLAKGASPTYQEQWQSSRDQARAISDAAKTLAANPDRLSGELELYFRILGTDTMLDSLIAATRTYQSPAAAQDLASLAAENGANRERMRLYILNLTEQREREFEVMDREAQRCRGMMFNQPAGRKK